MGADLSAVLAKAEHLSPHGPAHGDLWRQAHQILGGQLRWFLAIENGGDDVGRQGGQTQQA